MYREDVGTEKELEQKRKKYASDPKVKERKKKYYYEKYRKPREMEKRKRDLEEGARRAKESVIYHEKSLRSENKTFQWILEGESQNLRLINHHFTTLSSHFLALPYVSFTKLKFRRSF